MVHIKKLNEMNSQTLDDKTEYIIRSCDCIIAEDSYTRGEEYNPHTIELDMGHIKSDTLEGLMRKFNDEQCHGHEFNMNDWYYDPYQENRLVLAVTGKFTTANKYVDFVEPSAKDLDDFEQGKCNLTSFMFDLYIEKHEIRNDITKEAKRLGIGTNI